MTAQKTLDLIHMPGGIQVKSSVEDLAGVAETFFVRVRVQIENHFVPAAIALAPSRGRPTDLPADDGSGGDGGPALGTAADRLLSAEPILRRAVAVRAESLVVR